MKVGDKVRVVNKKTILFGLVGEVVAIFEYNNWPVEVEMEDFTFVRVEFEGARKRKIIFDYEELELIDA